MNDMGMQLFVYIAMFGLPIAAAMLLVCIIVTDIVHNAKFRKQKKRFFELYGICLEKHGIAFTRKIYEACKNPWIGMTNMIAVFEHHCGIKNELSAMLEERKMKT